MEGWKLVLLIGFWVIFPLLLAFGIAGIFGSMRPEHAEEAKRHPELKRYDNYALAALALPSIPGVLVDIGRSLGGHVPLAVLSTVTILRFAGILAWVMVNRARRRELDRLEASER